jgi:hypothetical protein
MGISSLSGSMPTKVERLARARQLNLWIKNLILDFTPDYTERVELWAVLLADLCRDCGTDQSVRYCHCTNDE